MAKITNGFETTAGNEFLKKEDTAGRTYYVKSGEGRVSRQSFAGAKKHFKYALNVGDEGRGPSGISLPPDMRGASVEELEGMTNVPFTKRGFAPIRGKAETPTERARAERNRFWGFYEANYEQFDSKDEAAREYLRFRREISDAEDPDARAIIRRRYNLGGS